MECNALFSLRVIYAILYTFREEFLINVLRFSIALKIFRCPGSRLGFVFGRKRCRRRIVNATVGYLRLGGSVTGGVHAEDWKQKTVTGADD